MELSVQFDLIDSQSDLGKYRLLILPDTIPASEALKEKLDAFAARGGKLIASFRAGLDEHGKAFRTNLGALYKGEAPFSPDFILPRGAFGEGMPESEHVMYLRGALGEAAPGGEVLLPAIEPVFNRTWEHFCSHLHSPSSGKASYPAVIQSAAGLYFIHPIFAQYQTSAVPWVKKLVRNAIRMLMPGRLMAHDGPTSLITNIMAQDAENRWVVHLLHYMPERKCATLDIIDNRYPLSGLSVWMTVPKQVVRVRLAPEGRIWRLKWTGTRCASRCPRSTGTGC
jgi:hypothetical protein